MEKGMYYVGRDDSYSPIVIFVSDDEYGSLTEELSVYLISPCRWWTYIVLPQPVTKEIV